MLAAGTLIAGRYVLEAPLGEGGAAEVWRARHRELGTAVALKILRRGSASLRRRLLAEGRHQGALRHPNVVTVHDVVEVDGAPALVLELVEGPSLDRLLAGRRLTLEQVDAIARGILAGVAAAHDAGLVHRDLKPANVLLQVGPEGLLPKVGDFGLVKAMAEEVGFTREGSTLGSPPYMSPEQARDPRAVDPRSDVWSLGVLLYELVTGQLPFQGEDPVALLQDVLRADPVPAEARVPNLPPRMARALRAALQADPAARPDHARALAELWVDGPFRGTREEWDSEILHLARWLTPPSSQEEGPADGATVDVEALGPPVEPAAESPAAPAAPPPRRWIFGLALGLAFLVGGLGAWLALNQGPLGEPAHFTLSAAPPLADPRADKLFDEAWRALLAADVPRALRDLGALAEEHPSSLDVELAMILANRLMDPRSGAEEQVHDPRWDPAERTGYQREILLALRAAEPIAALARWVEQAPDDALARCLLVSRTAWDLPEQALVDLAPLGELPLGQVLQARALERLGRVEEAEAQAQAAARAAPGSGWVDATRAEDHLLAQRWEAAAEAARRALSREPGLGVAKVRLAEALVRGGAVAEAQDLARRMDDPLVPAVERVRFVERYAQALADVGYLEEALAEVERTFQAVGPEEQATAVDRLLLLALSFEEMAGAFPLSPERLEVLRQRALLPGVPTPVRDHVQQVLLLTEAERAVADGDLARAEALTRRLEGGWAARVQTARALAQGPVPQELEEDCLGGVLAFRWLSRYERRLEAAELLLALHRNRVCTPYGYVRGFAAEVSLTAGELLLERGDREGAARALADAAVCWPYPQPGARHALRREQLQAALAAAD